MTAALDLRHDPEVVAMDRRRGHRFQAPADTLARIPALYATEGTPMADKVVHLHYFAGGWDWHLVELDPEQGLAFGRVSSPMCPDGEWGYVDLAELAVGTVVHLSALKLPAGVEVPELKLGPDHDVAVVVAKHARGEEEAPAAEGGEEKK